jgi:hypothetical protein
MPTSHPAKAIQGHDDEPSTKGDLRLLARYIEQATAKSQAHFDQGFDELRDYFDAQVEIIKDEMKGANADEISLLHDTDENHEQRLTAVERKIGLR